MTSYDDYLCPKHLPRHRSIIYIHKRNKRFCFDVFTPCFIRGWHLARAIPACRRNMFRNAIRSASAESFLVQARPSVMELT